MDWDADFCESAHLLDVEVEDIPLRQFNFVVAEQRGAYSVPHISPSGLSTMVRILAGQQYVIVRRPRRQKDIIRNLRSLAPSEVQTVVIPLKAGDVMWVPVGSVKPV